MSDRRAKVYLALLVAALAALLFTAPGRGFWVIDPDAAAYVGLARSLVAGEGYTLQGIPHAKFPPGFPLLLSLPMLWTGDATCYGAMRDCVTLMGLATVPLAFAVGRRLLALAPGRALALATTTAVSIYLLQYSVAYLRSETTFTAFFLTALLIGQRWHERGGSGNALLAGLACGAALSVRSAGLAGIAAIAIARFARSNPWRVVIDRFALIETALFAAASLAPMVAHQTWVERRSHQLGIVSTNYGDELLAAYALDLTKDVDTTMPKIGIFSAEMLTRVKGNLAALALSLGKFVVNDNKGANLATRPNDLSLHPGGFALLALLALGIFAFVRRGFVVIALTTTLYLGLYLIWPFNQQQRFYQPIAPLLLAALGFGAVPLLRFALRLGSRDAGRWLMFALVALVTAWIASSRSTDARVLGRWSTSLAAILVVLVLFGSALAILAVRFAGRRLAIAPYETRLHGFAIAGILLLGTGSFLVSLRGLLLEHQEFLKSREMQPVSAPFEKIKTNPDLISLLEKLVSAAAPSDLVMSDIPKMIHEMTGLPTTPLRFSSRDRRLELDTPQGRPRFLYYSREIPQADSVFDALLATKPHWLVPIHEVNLREGNVTIPLALYQVLDD